MIHTHVPVLICTYLLGRLIWRFSFIWLQLHLATYDILLFWPMQKRLIAQKQLHTPILKLWEDVLFHLFSPCYGRAKLSGREGWAQPKVQLCTLLLLHWQAFSASEYCIYTFLPFTLFFQPPGAKWLPLLSEAVRLSWGDNHRNDYWGYTLLLYARPYPICGLPPLFNFIEWKHWEASGCTWLKNPLQ